MASPGNIAFQLHNMKGYAVATAAKDVQVLYRIQDGILLCAGKATATSLDDITDMFAPGCLYIYLGDATTTSKIYKNSGTSITAPAFNVLST